MSNNKIDISFPTGNALWALLLSQARQEAKLAQMQEMLEEVYTEVQNKDLEEVKKQLDLDMAQLHQDKLRAILSDLGISTKAIEIALESMTD